MSSVIETQYELECRTVSDINEHLPTLRRYAAECDSIAEFGVRSVVSTWALLSGLISRAQPQSASTAQRLVCVDVEPVPRIAGVSEIARAAGVTLQFQQINSVDANLDGGVDMLFIDTWHVYGHLRRELAAHHAKVRRYIAMHDTEIDGEHGETLRCGETLRWDQKIMEAVAASGYSVEDVSTGLKRAIQEFLAEHPEWCIDSVYVNNNGLTVLRRIT
jgi:cephalosporin hydroxylase